MLEYRSEPAASGRPASGADRALLARIQAGMGTRNGPIAGTRRCPCCGQPVRAGQRLTTIHGTTVHVSCASARATARTESYTQR